MQLLVKRDTTVLERTEGIAEVDSSVPENLQNVYVTKPAQIMKEASQSLENKLIITPTDFKQIDAHLSKKPRTAVNGLWSGYRSAIVRGDDGLLYRVKGVALNLEKPRFTKEKDGTYEVFGGQPTFSAEFEKEGSDEFNKILAKEGIEPVMTCKGYWHYAKEVGSKKNKQKMSASLMQIEGDTRLDEFLSAVDTYYFGRGVYYSDAGMHKKQVEQLYREIGAICGTLKHFMDRNDQTWGSNKDRTNAHIGNVVLYRKNDKIYVGFVDFDAASGKKYFSKTKILGLQTAEFVNIQKSILSPTVSIRLSSATKFEQTQTMITHSTEGMRLRDEVRVGFDKGYFRSNKTIKNWIDAGRVDELLNSIKSCAELIRSISDKFYGRS